ncbi:MAG: ABC transporter ATP-binding protein/permease [Oscillospiraceae bacterium]|jgi:ATP-binding cassette subfamily B protein/subfamily B ATP-binding cassette protein MsbA|nr:ABC transporter ATP-binding protein/permease [Oscillospiraceae bacterium]
MKIILRFLKMARPWWWAMVLAVLALIAMAGLNLLTPQIVRSLTAGLMENTLTQQGLLRLALLLVGSYLLRWATRFAAMYLAHVAAWRFVGELIAEVYAKLQTLSMRFFGQRQTGDMMSRAVNDSRQMEVLIAHTLPDLFSNICVVLGVTALLFTIHPLLALLTLAPVPGIVLLSRVFAKKVAPLFRRNSELLGQLSSVYQDNISGMKEIQAFGRETTEYPKMLDFCRLFGATNLHANFAAGLFHPSVELCTSLGTVVVVGVGGWFALKDQLSVADLMGFFMCLGLFYQPLTTLARLVEDASSSTASGRRVLEILDAEAEVRDAPGAQPLQNVRGQIEFRDVSFAYTPGEPVLDHISFTAKPGQMLALVGATGVGKTTIVSLIERFYDPNGGQILLDGQDISQVTLKSLRENLSMVLQDVFLFNGTVAENIAYGLEGATRAQVEEAARAACAEEFIRQLPGGYDTPIGERGQRLSGGQKQRLAIARAVLRGAPVLLLDEATSAVDNETEAQIQAAIERLCGKHTVIVIAHRLSTILRADCILVIDEGRIKEQGTHQALLDQGGIYAGLHALA